MVCNMSYSLTIVSINDNTTESDQHWFHRRSQRGQWSVLKAYKENFFWCFNHIYEIYI